MLTKVKVKTSLVGEFIWTCAAIFLGEKRKTATKVKCFSKGISNISHSSKNGGDRKITLFGQMASKGKGEKESY